MAKDVGQPGGLGGVGEPAVEAGNDVPVSEEVIWKNRAMEAEEALSAAKERIAALEGELAQANESVKQVERRGQIDLELTAAKAVDLETARLLTEATISQMDEPDVSVAVRELCDRKPFLFAGDRQGVHVGGVSMGPGYSSGVGDGSHELESIASQARSSGDRGELLRYLRVRRGV